MAYLDSIARQFLKLQWYDFCW